MRPLSVFRPRLLVLLVLAAVIGAAVAVLPALAAAPSEAKLEVNQNCVEANWPCWATPGSSSPASKVTIATGGEVMFTDKASTEATVAWTGSAPACTGVPTSAMTGWEGKCKFEQPGTYKFESSTLWPEYTKYEIVVEGAATGTTPTTTTTPTIPTTTTPSAPTTPSEPGHGSPLGALKLASTQRGSTVRGQVKVSQTGTGGGWKSACLPLPTRSPRRALCTEARRAAGPRLATGRQRVLLRAAERQRQGRAAPPPKAGVDRKGHAHPTARRGDDPHPQRRRAYLSWKAR